MKIFLVVVTILFSTMSFAETKYDAIYKMYNNSQPITFDKLVGIYSGRCYDYVNQDLARASILGAIEIDQQDSHGPAFPNPKISKIIEASEQGAEPSHYDNFNYSDARKIFSGLIDYYTPVLIQGETLSTVLSGVSKSTLSVRKYENFLVTQYVSGVDNRVQVRGDGYINLVKGQTWGLCYYFKKLTN